MLKKYAFLRVIEFLAANNKELTMLEIAKNSKTSIGMTKLILDNLEKEDLIKRRRINKKTSLFIISDNFLTREVRILNLLIEIYKTGLVEELNKIYKDNILSILLFGSSADGSYDKNSDMDILVITRKEAKHEPVKVRLKKELNILLYSLKEWKEKANKDPVFYEKVILNNIILYGENPIVK